VLPCRSPLAQVFEGRLKTTLLYAALAFVASLGAMEAGSLARSFLEWPVDLEPTANQFDAGSFALPTRSYDVSSSRPEEEPSRFAKRTEGDAESLQRLQVPGLSRTCPHGYNCAACCAETSNLPVICCAAGHTASSQLYIHRNTNTEVG